MADRESHGNIQRIRPMFTSSKTGSVLVNVTCSIGTDLGFRSAKCSGLALAAGESDPEILPRFWQFGDCKSGTVPARLFARHPLTVIGQLITRKANPLAGKRVAL